MSSTTGAREIEPDQHAASRAQSPIIHDDSPPQGAHTEGVIIMLYAKQPRSKDDASSQEQRGYYLILRRRRQVRLIIYLDGLSIGQRHVQQGSMESFQLAVHASKSLA